TWVWLAAFFGDLVLAALLDSTAMNSAKPLPTAAILILFALNIAGIGSLTFGALSYFRMQRDAAERRSEELLLNVLPEPIAARLNRDKDWDLSFRVGINCGPAVAGIVGRQKFHYDVWGDTVNLASRMESHGLPDRIQVTEAVYERLKSEFVFERRGFIEVKG